MKAIKIYLAIVTVLLLGAISLGVYVWYTIQTLGTNESSQTEVRKETNVPVTESSTTETETVAAPEPIVVTKESLTPTQQKMLETFGLSQDSFTITGDMIVCSEGAVGKDRLAEITNGAAPSPLESMKLLPCFKK